MLDLLLLGQKTAPDFFWDARGGVLPPGATFTRGSSGWSFNSAGVLTQAGNNIARFDYDPATLTPLGYLAEMQSTNGIVNSQNFSGTGWSNERVTITGAAVTAPDGTNTATRMTPTAVTGSHDVFSTIVASANDSNGFSVFAKAGTGFTNLLIGTGAQTANVYAVAVFDLQNGVVGETKVGSSSGSVSASIRAVGGGWYRCSVIVSSSDAAVRSYFVGPAPLASGNTFGATGQISWTPIGADFLYVWGAQQDTKGVGVSSYIPTAGSAVTRSQDNLSMPLMSLPGWTVSAGGVLVATYRLHTVYPLNTNEQAAATIYSDGSNVYHFAGNFGEAAFKLRTAIRAGNIYQAIIGNTATPAPFVRMKQAAGWSTSRVVQSVGGALDDSTSGAFKLPIADTIDFCSYAGGTNKLGGTLEAIAYYSGARSDAFIQAVSR